MSTIKRAENVIVSCNCLLSGSEDVVQQSIVGHLFTYSDFNWVDWPSVNHLRLIQLHAEFDVIYGRLGFVERPSSSAFAFLLGFALFASLPAIFFITARQEHRFSLHTCESFRHHDVQKNSRRREFLRDVVLFNFLQI